MVEQKTAYETSSATMARIKTIWEKSLAPFWKDVSPKDIDQQLITTFINWHKKNRPGIQLVNVFKYLGNVFAVMIEAGAMDIARRPKLELPKDEQKHHAKQKGRYITDDEFQSILNHAMDEFRLFLLIAYCCGMRKMEIGKLEVSRIRRAGERFIASLDTDDTKTGLAREVPFPIFLHDLIDRQLELKSKYLFPMGSDSDRHISPQAIDGAWKFCKKEIKGRMRFHDLRHSCASNLAKSNINPIVAVTMLGMSLQTFQKTYLKLTAQDLIIASESAVVRFNKNGF